MKTRQSCSGFAACRAGAARRRVLSAALRCLQSQRRASHSDAATAAATTGRAGDYEQEHEYE